MILVNYFIVVMNYVLAKNFEFVFAGFQFLRVRTCVDLFLFFFFCIPVSTLVQIRTNRFVLKSAEIAFPDCWAETHFWSIS